MKMNGLEADAVRHRQVFESVVDHEGRGGLQRESINQKFEYLPIGFGDPFVAGDDGAVEPTEERKSLESQRVRLCFHVGQGITRHPAYF
jgi:hypothetical protein